MRDASQSLRESRSGDSVSTESDRVRFGRSGEVIDILSAGLRFVLTRREVFDRVRGHLGLRPCRQWFGPPLVPYFQPLVVEDSSGEPWYLAEDDAFCHRAQAAGEPIRANTTVRLWRVGGYQDISTGGRTPAAPRTGTATTPSASRGGRRDRDRQPDFRPTPW
ncbi:hypothetical protein [Fimbriiglobus ruber]|uniref:hypothetical protein n=1 Tax=Fimbriiglobus ruber TaxID=1908690 RepID=UPI001179E9E0|nr:hypothetical protein [Fimbriiglobus ruber]